jgi:hypothetical protein
MDLGEGKANIGIDPDSYPVDSQGFQPRVLGGEFEVRTAEP